MDCNTSETIKTSIGLVGIIILGACGLVIDGDAGAAVAIAAAGALGLFVPSPLSKLGNKNGGGDSNGQA